MLLLIRRTQVVYWYQSKLNSSFGSLSVLFEEASAGTGCPSNSSRTERIISSDISCGSTSSSLCSSSSFRRLLLLSAAAGAVEPDAVIKAFEAELLVLSLTSVKLKFADRLAVQVFGDAVLEALGFWFGGSLLALKCTAAGREAVSPDELLQTEAETEALLLLWAEISLRERAKTDCWAPTKVSCAGFDFSFESPADAREAELLAAENDEDEAEEAGLEEVDSQSPLLSSSQHLEAVIEPEEVAAEDCLPLVVTGGGLTRRNSNGSGCECEPLSSARESGPAPSIIYEMVLYGVKWNFSRRAPFERRRTTSCSSSSRLWSRDRRMSAGMCSESAASDMASRFFTARSMSWRPSR